MDRGCHLCSNVDRRDFGLGTVHHLELCSFRGVRNPLLSVLRSHDGEARRVECVFLVFLVRGSDGDPGLLAIRYDVSPPRSSAPSPIVTRVLEDVSASPLARPKHVIPLGDLCIDWPLSPQSPFLFL